MRQTQVQIGEEENDAEASPPVLRKRRQSHPVGKLKMFSAGFRERLEKLTKMADDLPPKYYYQGLSQVCELDHSQMCQEEAEGFARLMFGLYYTDKTVKKLTFEKNCVKLVAGYCLK